MSVTLKVPSIGESIREATVGLWKKAEGDWIQLDEPLVEIESEKATLEVPAPASGVLKKILRRQGETVAIGEALADIDETAKPAEKPAARPEGKPPEGKPAARAQVPPPSNGARPPQTAGAGAGAAAAAPASASATASAEPVRAAPSARKLMADAGLAAAEVHGSGRGGRIQALDVTRALETRQVVPAAGGGERQAGDGSGDGTVVASVDGGAFLDERTPMESALERVVPMTTLRKTIARRLVEAQHTAAILTTFNEIDMSAVLELRERHQERFSKQHGIKLGFTSFFVKAAIDALRAFPAVNAEVRGTNIIYKDHYDIGVAVGGGKGLVVPVVREADRLSFAEVEKAVANLAVRAKENRLQMADLEGGTFTISNGGVYGSLLSTPILNPPQSGILGLHAIQKRAVVIDDQIVIRPMMYVALSYDHRIVDGREAVQFLVRVKECVESPDRILLEV
jgi:2-oxoglutarate dehydrogenase E2 component (dihydrolipoamide succinyltransferase)